MLAQVLFEAIKADTIFCNKVFIVQIFFNDHLAHGQGHGAICAWTNWDPLVGLLRGLCKGWVNHHQLAPTFARLDQRPAFP